MSKGCAIATILMLLTGGGWCEGMKFPGADPGPAQASIAHGTFSFSNRAVVAVWAMQPHSVVPFSFRDVQGRASLTPTSEVFQITLTDGGCYSASGLLPDGSPRLRSLQANPRFARLAARSSGKFIEAPLRSADGRLQAVWRGILLDDSHYVRQEIELKAARAA